MASLHFRLKKKKKKKKEKKNNFLNEVKYNDLMIEKHEKVSSALN